MAIDSTASGVTANAPGKLILSGEHAVVYGQPAVLVAVDRHVQTTITTDGAGQCRLRVPALQQEHTYSLDNLRTLQYTLDDRHHRFLNGTLDIDAVVGRPIEFFAYALALGLARAGWPDAGMSVTVTTTLPIGAGMGSSAAAALSVLRSVVAYCHTDWESDWGYEAARCCERLQHGYSSGADPYVVLHGGFVRFCDGQGSTIDGRRRRLWVVQTGKPESSTGECVMHVRQQWAASSIWTEFADIVAAVESSLCNDRTHDLCALVRANHRLLVTIGVVPERVRAFVDKVEALLGGAAKVCGAGSIDGEAAGCVLVISETEPTALCDEFGYEFLDLTGGDDGVRIV